MTHEVDSAASPVPAMDHHVFNVDAADRGEVVAQLVGGQGRTLAFARTKHQAKRWARTLTASGIHAVDLHGNLSQAARQRNLAAFADGDVRVLVATDIAARGIHVDDITLVVHIDPPAEHKAYLHRSGRTARAGAAGVVVTVATHDQRRDVADLMRRAAITPTQHKVRAGDCDDHRDRRAERPACRGGQRPAHPGGAHGPRLGSRIRRWPRSVVRRRRLGLRLGPVLGWVQRPAAHQLGLSSGPGVGQLHQPFLAGPLVSSRAPRSRPRRPRVRRADRPRSGRAAAAPRQQRLRVAGPVGPPAPRAERAPRPDRTSSGRCLADSQDRCPRPPER